MRDEKFKQITEMTRFVDPQKLNSRVQESLIDERRVCGNSDGEISFFESFYLKFSISEGLIYFFYFVLSRSEIKKVKFNF